MKKLLSVIAAVFFLALACNCSSSPKQIESGNAFNTIKNATSKRGINRDRRDFLTERTVQVLFDCSPKKGIVFFGPKDPETMEDGRGTGIIVRSYKKASYIFTAAHVVQVDDKKHEKNLDCQIKVKRNPEQDKFERAIPAKIVVAHRSRDIAVLVVEEDLNVDTELELNPILGEDVLAVGYPVQKMNVKHVGLSITKGTLSTINVPASSKSRSKGKFHRTTAQVYFGNSGGGLWTKEGKLLGIIAVLFAKDYLPFEGYYYIKPVNEIIDLLKYEDKYEEVFGLPQ